VSGSQGSRAVTIREVAQHAGVSVATVSRVLNESGYFDEETGRRVREAVQALGYRRNVHWQRLSADSSRTLCFLLGNRESLNSMQMRLLVACEREAKDSGYDLVFSRFDYDTAARPNRLTLPRLLADRGLVDGVILIGRHAQNLLESLDGIGMPWVLLGNNFEGDVHSLRENAVAYDEESGCFEAASYLIRLGHRRIAFVGNQHWLWFRRRYRGYERAVRENGLTPAGVTHNWSVGGIEYGRMAAAELLRSKTPPTAILAANDELAAGVWKELVSRGISIPREMSLCGFGDREEFQILEPSLTTIAVFPEKLGARLARLILGRLDGSPDSGEGPLHPCHLVERASCGPPPPEVRKDSGK
jgi:LacI family transcriptional regulator